MSSRERLSRGTRASAASSRAKAPPQRPRQASPSKQQRTPTTKAQTASGYPVAKPEVEGDETDSTHSSDSATLKTSASFLSQILGSSGSVQQQPQQPQQREMPEDVKAWLEHGNGPRPTAISSHESDGEDGPLCAPADGSDLLDALDAAESQDAADAALRAAVGKERRDAAHETPDYSEPEAPPHTAVFVHFIPPPMRENGKKDLAWIIHTCDGSGCREARHVQFHSISGFSTFEGAPPEQTEGRACDCAIANHHLRGFGRPRWVGEDAIIEHHGGRNIGYGADAVDADPRAMVNVKAYRDEARKQASQLARAREEIKKLRGLREEMTRSLDAAVAAQDAAEESCAKELAVMKQKKTSVEDRYRYLRLRYEALKASSPELDGAPPPAAVATGPATEAEADVPSETELQAEDEASAQGARQVKLSFGCWQCFVVCLPQPSQSSKLGCEMH